MSNKITITASDGKIFTGTIDSYAALVNELNAYESDLKLKKQKAEAERKAKEDKLKRVSQYRETKLKELNDDLAKLYQKVRDYEKETGYKIIYEYDYTTSKLVVKDTQNTLDFAWNNVLDDLLDAFHHRR